MSSCAVGNKGLAKPTRREYKGPVNNGTNPMTQIRDHLLYITAPALIGRAYRAAWWLIKVIAAFVAMVIAAALIGMASVAGS